MNIGGTLIRDRYEELTLDFTKTYDEWIKAKDAKMPYDEVEYRWSEYVRARDIRDSYIKSNASQKLFED